MTEGIFSRILGSSDNKSEKEVVERLGTLMAHLMVLRFKLINGGFNIVSPNYEQYRKVMCCASEELLEICMEGGERIRSLNQPVNLTLKDILEYNKDAVKEWHPSGGFFMKLRDVEMLRTIVGDFDTVVKKSCEFASFIEKTGDRPTADYLDCATRKLQKIQWIFRSHLAGHEREEHPREEQQQ